MVVSAGQHCSYSINNSDQLTHLSPEWFSFATENNAPELTESALLGHSLWEFVEGGETIQLYKRVLNRVRLTNQEQCLPFRCDSPTLERHMRMNILPEESGEILFDCTIVKVRTVPELQLLDPVSPRTEEELDMCSFCKRVEVPPLGWLEIAEVEGRSRLYRAERVPKVRQTVCPLCRERAETM